MKTIRDFDFSGKKVLVRCDFQVPLDEEGNVLDDFKIRATLPTIEYLLDKKAKIILMSHLKPMESQKKAESLKLILPRIAELLKKEIKFSDDCLGDETAKEIGKMNPGEIILLENLRAHKEEEANDDDFARQLAGLGDIYINDAFGVDHRSHASLVGVPKYLPSGAGLLLEKEIGILGNLMKNPVKPSLVIIGGAKVETKTSVIDKLSENADFVLIGELIEKEIKEKKVKFAYPEKIIGPVDSLDTFDLGPKTIKLFEEKIGKAQTIFWSGPLGKIEDERYSGGTEEIVRAIVRSGAFSVAGGGETVEFINKLGLAGQFNHVSTGGGAMLAFLAEEKLPGIEALEK